MDALTYIAVSGLVLIGLIWASCWIQAHRLLWKFEERFPEAAEKAFPPYAHPEKCFYFFRRRSRDLLESDPEIWRLRQLVKKLLVMSIASPICWFLLIVLVAILLGSAGMK